jgi:hypothetical protein
VLSPGPREFSADRDQSRSGRLFRFGHGPRRENLLTVILFCAKLKRPVFQPDASPCPIPPILPTLPACLSGEISRALAVTFRTMRRCQAEAVRETGNGRQDPVQREPATWPPYASPPSSSPACRSVRQDSVQQPPAAGLRSICETTGVSQALQHPHSGEHPIHREEIAPRLGEKPIGTEQLAILYLDAAAGAEDADPLPKITGQPEPYRGVRQNAMQPEPAGRISPLARQLICTEAGTRNKALCNVKSPSHHLGSARIATKTLYNVRRHPRRRLSSVTRTPGPCADPRQDPIQRENTPPRTCQCANEPMQRGSRFDSPEPGGYAPPPFLSGTP